MFNITERSSALWRELTILLVVAFLILPQIGYAQDTSNEYVMIPDTVTKLLDIDDLYMGSFSKGFQVSASHPCFTVVDGVLFSKDQKTLVRYPYMRTDREYVIPNGTTSIEEDAFQFADHLHTVTLTASVTDCLDAMQNDSTCFVDFEVVPENPLYSTVKGVLYSKDQKELLCYPRGRKETHFAITEGTETIGEAAFYHCYYLSYISMPDTVHTIGNSAFGWMIDLKRVKLSSNLKIIEFAAFASSTKLRNVTLPEGLTNIEENAFAQTWLTNIHIPKTVNFIGHYAFSGCELLHSVYFENKNVNITDDAFDLFDAVSAEETFGWKGKPIVLTMYVYHGSTAEKYAVENGYALQYLD
jgi:hypothetical protein